MASAGLTSRPPGPPEAGEVDIDYWDVTTVVGSSRDKTWTGDQEVGVMWASSGTDQSCGAETITLKFSVKGQKVI